MTSIPEGLPGIPVEVQTSPLDKARFCPACHIEARIVSNYLGTNAHCPQCKNNWPITSVSQKMEIPIGPPRGISKVTLVEPDWSIAMDNPGGSSDEQIGPRHKT
jgi:hypothetical protein